MKFSWRKCNNSSAFSNSPLGVGTMNFLKNTSESWACMEPIYLTCHLSAQVHTLLSVSTDRFHMERKRPKSHQAISSCATELLWLLTGPTLFWSLRLRRALEIALRSSVDTNNKFQTTPLAEKANFSSNFPLSSNNTTSQMQAFLFLLPQFGSFKGRINLSKKHSFQHSDSNSGLSPSGSYFRASRDLWS